MTAMAKIPFAELQAQFRAISAEINAAIQGVLDRSDYISDDELYFNGYCHLGDNCKRKIR
jgi:hypothetical protein